MSVGMPLGLPRRVQDQDDTDFSSLALGDEAIFLMASGKFANFGRRRYDPRWFAGSSGAKLESAFNEASGDGRTVVIPDGEMICDRQLIADGIDVIGETPAATIKWSSGIGANTSGIQVRNTTESQGWRQPLFQGFCIEGPGTYGVGVDNAGMDGVEVVGQASPLFQDMNVSKFRKGYNYNNDVGHVYMRGGRVFNNYFGLYFSKGHNGDFPIDHTVIAGNNFASIGTGYRGIGGMSIKNVHLGFSPYGIYQEKNGATSSSEFLIGCEIDARFEAIGNAAVFSEFSGIDPEFAWIGYTKFLHVAMTWTNGTTYKLTTGGHNDNYSFVGAALQAWLHCEGWDGAFLKGDLGTFRFGQCPYLSDEIPVELVGSQWQDDGTLFTVASGGLPQIFINGNRLGINRQPLTRSFVAGSSSVAQPANGAFTGWLVEVAEHSTIHSAMLEVISAGSRAVKFCVYDATDGLTECPRIFMQAGAQVPGDAGLVTETSTSQRIALPPGIYAIGWTWNAIGTSCAGAVSNTSQLMGAIANTSVDVYATNPATITLSRTTTGINLGLS